jgi:hypothetical protein
MKLRELDAIIQFRIPHLLPSSSIRNELMIAICKVLLECKIVFVTQIHLQNILGNKVHMIIFGSSAGVVDYSGRAV